MLKEQLKKIKQKTNELLKKSNENWSKLKKELSNEGIFFKNFNSLTQDEQSKLYQIFKANVFPVLTPQAIDPSHPFPFLFNQGHFLLMEMNKRGKKKSIYSIIVLPKNLKRFYDVSISETVKNYVSLEEMVSSYASELFSGYEVKNYLSARVTRDSDIEVEEEPARAFVFDPGVSLSTIVDTINAVGAGASDLVAILEALRESGALRAELIII